MIRIVFWPFGRVARKSILIKDECTSTRFVVGSVFSGRAEAKFHSSSVPAPFRDVIPACDADSVRSNRGDEVSPGLLPGCLLKGDEDLELDATSAANGSAGTCGDGAIHARVWAYCLKIAP